MGLAAALARLTVVCHGTLRTKRTARQTDGCAEFHDSLVKRTGAVGRQQKRGERRETGAGLRAGDESGFGGEAAEDAHGVAVENGVREIEGDAGHGRCGVGADAGQSANFFISGREQAAGGDVLRGAMQVSRARVVAEAGPEGEDIFHRRGGERFDGREAGEEAFIVRDDGGGAGLLEHDFGEPDRVGIARGAPGKFAAAAAVPGEQRAAELGYRGGRQLAMIESRTMGLLP